MKTTSVSIPISAPRKTKVAVIREEYVSITEKFEHALVLNQFVYWSERVYDFDKFIAEENSRKEKHGMEDTQELNHGWIYKKAEDLSDELMTGWSGNTTRKHLKALVQAGYIEERTNPKYKWNQTKQYRVDLNKVEQDLLEQGYSIPGFTVTKAAISNFAIGRAPDEIAIAESEIQSVDSAIVPITETIIKTTTTAPPEQPAPSPPASLKKEPSSSCPSSHDLNNLLQTIPEEHRSKQVEARLERALAEGHSVDYLNRAIAYTNQKPRKRYASYLGQSIDNPSWHAGLDHKEELDRLQADIDKLRQQQEQTRQEEHEKAIAERDYQQQQSTLAQKHAEVNRIKEEEPERYRDLEQQVADTLRIDLKKPGSGGRMKIKFEMFRILGL